jgi:outer membrane protein OmpA-like peptidoglycan-associated protein
MRTAIGALVLIGAAVSTASAQTVTPTLALEGTAQTVLTTAYRDRFDWGGGATARAGLEVIGPLAIQLGFGTAWYPVAGQEPGNLYDVELGARGFFRIDPVAGGPWIDANAGVGITGSLVRFVFDAGVGWDFFPVPAFGLGPVVRYQQIVQPDGEPIGEDAYILQFGVNLIVRIELSQPEPTIIEREVERAPVDSDGDGVFDDQDLCEGEHEDTDGHEDGDGCIDPDNDSDGLLDADDQCPDAAETRNGHDDTDGCPDETPEDPRGQELPQVVLFRVGVDRISPRFRDTIQGICDLMAQRPELRVRVVGHADEQGTRAGNHRLGASRAGAVAEQLVICGLDPARIETSSYGDTQPACPGGASAEDACHERNRRVGFVLLEPAEP